MHKLILFRLLQFPLILAIIYLLTFALAWVAPGDPFQNERNVDPVTTAMLKREYHAESAWGFLYHHAGSIVTRGDFGPSMKYPERPVNSIIAEGLPVSVTLGLF